MNIVRQTAKHQSRHANGSWQQNHQLPQMEILKVAVPFLEGFGAIANTTTRREFAALPHATPSQHCATKEKRHCIVFGVGTRYSGSSSPRLLLLFGALVSLSWMPTPERTGLTFIRRVQNDNLIDIDACLNIYLFDYAAQSTTFLSVPLASSSCCFASASTSHSFWFYSCCVSSGLVQK